MTPCDGCTKEWCDEYAEPDGGHDTIQNTRESATVPAETLVEVAPPGRPSNASLTP